MISKLIVMSRQFEVLVEKDYRTDITSACEEAFILKVKAAKGQSIQPHFIHYGTRFYNIQRNGLYFVACSVAEVSPILVIEFLSRLYHICKDFCGVVTEQSVQANLLLIYELLDEIMNEGYMQLGTTDKLQPFIQSVPVVLQRERSPAKDLSSRVFGIETKMLPGSAANKPVVDTGATDSTNKRNEIFIEVVEKLVVVINSDSTVSRMEVNGSINMKNFLIGYPQIKLALNEDLVVTGAAEKGYGSQVQLDRCSFHQCVKESDFATSRVLVLDPPVGEFSAMTYHISGATALHQPFRLKAYVGDADGSRDLTVTLRLNCDIPARKEAIKVKVKQPVPVTVSSISTKLGSSEQSAELQTLENMKQILWQISKLPGQTEAIAQFRLINHSSDKINRHEIGPINLDFEISGYTSSGLLIKEAKIQKADKSQPRQHWIRHVTVSESYVVRT